MMVKGNWLGFAIANLALSIIFMASTMMIDWKN
jgi:hypothetical protein